MAPYWSTSHATVYVLVAAWVVFACHLVVDGMCSPRLAPDLELGDSESVQTISELVKTQKAASGLSYADMTDRAHKRGLSITRQQLSDLANNAPKGWPKSSEMVQALAVALDVSERAIVLAFATSFDINVNENRTPFENRLPAGINSVGAGMQDAILHIIQAAIEESDGRGNAAPMNQPAGDPGGTTHDLTAARERRQEREGEVPPLPASFAADSAYTEGMRLRDAIDAEGEESQDVAGSD